jgi:hypothetical protein
MPRRLPTRRELEAWQAEIAKQEAALEKQKQEFEKYVALNILRFPQESGVEGEATDVTDGALDLLRLHSAEDFSLQRVGAAMRPTGTQGREDLSSLCASRPPLVLVCQ